MTGDEIVRATVDYVRKTADGNDDPWLRGYGLGRIEIAFAYLGADHKLVAEAQEEIKRITRPIRSEA